jgi:hypothetical protein
MPDRDEQPTETSPLLSNAPSHHGPRHPVDPSGGIVPEGVDPCQRHNDSEEEGDGGDIERQRSHASNDGQSKQFEGIPEVRKQMKWLFPAMGIGVRFC